MALLEVTNLTIELSGRTILDGITLAIERGERVAILGHNGSGKTTLAQCLAGWLPSPGKLTFEGREWKDWPLPERSAAVQFVGQLPVQQLSGREFTVRDEIAFGPGNLGLPPSEVSSRTEDALESCKLQHLADRDPFTLSGGEQQRTVIASALAMQPRLLILDEPVTNLDPEAAQQIIRLVSELPSEITVIWLDTSSKIALQFARRCLSLQNGKLIVDFPPHHVFHPPVAEAAHAAATAGIQADNLSFSYSPLAPVLENVSFQIQPGRIAAIAGRNGTGKSTLLRLCNALLKPVSGRIVVGGVDTRETTASKLARQVATVFQTPEQQIFASRVLDEISFGPKQLKWTRPQIDEAVSSALERTALSSLAASHPLDLSHAGRRFVALASALAMKPRLLLLDEPQQGLDHAAIRKLEGILQAEKAAGVTILFTCHDMDFIARNADDLLVFGSATLLRAGPVPAVFSDESLLQTAGLKFPDTLACLPQCP